MDSNDRETAAGITRRSLFKGAAALGTAGAFSSVVAACGGGGGKGGGASGTIHFISEENDPATEKIQRQMFANFEKKHPKIKINSEFLTGDKATSRIQQLVGAGQPPDLVKRDSAEVARSQANGLIEPVTDMVKQMENVNAANRLVVDGQDYLVPTDIGFNLLFYRKDVLDKASVSPPTTWDAFREALPKLQASSSSIHPNLFVTNAGGQYTGTIFVNYAWSNGVRLWDWTDNKWVVALDQASNTQKSVEVLDFFKVRDKYSPATGNYVFADVNQAYGSGKIAIIEYSGARTLVYLRSQAPDIAAKTGVSTMPYNKAPAQTLQVGGLAVFRNKGGVDRQIVKELALSMATGSLYLDYLWTVPGHLIPPSKALFKGKWRDHKYIGDDTELMAALDSRYDDCYPITVGPPQPGASATKPNLAGGDANTSNVYAQLVGNAIGAKKDEKASIQAAVAQMKKLEKTP